MLSAITILGKIVSDITSPAKAIARRRNSKKNLQTYLSISISSLDVKEDTGSASETYIPFQLNVDTKPISFYPPSYDSLDSTEFRTTNSEHTTYIDWDAVSALTATSTTSEESWEDVDDVESVDLLGLTYRFSLMSKAEQHIFNSNQLALGKQASRASVVHIVAVEENDNEEDQPIIPAVFPMFVRTNSPLSNSFMSATASTPIAIIEQPASPKELGELFFAKAHSQRTLAEARTRIARSYAFQSSTRAPIPPPSMHFSANRVHLTEPQSCSPPSVLGGLGRSSPLRSGWTADDL